MDKLATRNEEMNKNDIVLKTKQQFITKYFAPFFLVIVSIYSDYNIDRVFFNDINLYLLLGCLLIGFYVFTIFFSNQIIVTKQYLKIKYPLHWKDIEIPIGDVKSVRFKHSIYFLRIYVIYDRGHTEIGKGFIVLYLSNKSLKKLEEYFENEKYDKE